MSKVDEALAEIEQTLLTIAPRHEGLRDYSRLNLQPETMARVQEEIARYDHRVALLLAARDHASNLVADGHPALDVREVSAAVLADLQANKATIDAALGQFASGAAVTLQMVATVEPKVN